MMHHLALSVIAFNLGHIASYISSTLALMIVVYGFDMDNQAAIMFRIGLIARPGHPMIHQS